MRFLGHALPLVLAVAMTLLPVRAQAGTDEAIYWIELEGGEVFQIRGAERAPNDVVRFRRADGSIGYAATNRVLRIYNDEQTDLTDIVLQQRGRIGGPIEANRYRSFCFQGGDKSCCGGFLITEVGVLFALAGHGSDQDVFGNVDLGAMANVGRRSAVGASAFWETSSRYDNGGIRLRYRHWLGKRFSVELSPGIVLAAREPFDSPNVIGQVALNGADLMSFVLEVERDRYTYPGDSYYDPVWGYVQGPTRDRSETTVRAGLRGGSYVGSSALGLTAVGFLVLIGIFATTGGWD